MHLFSIFKHIVIVEKNCGSICLEQNAARDVAGFKKPSDIIGEDVYKVFSFCVWIIFQWLKSWGEGAGLP